MSKYKINGEPDFVGLPEIEATSIESAALKDDVASEMAWSEGTCETYVLDVKTNEVWLCEIEIEHIANVRVIKQVEVIKRDD